LAAKQTRTLRPLRSTRITRLLRYYEAARPCVPHRYSTPRRISDSEISLERPGGSMPEAGRHQWLGGSIPEASHPHRDDRLSA